MKTRDEIIDEIIELRENYWKRVEEGANGGELTSLIVEHRTLCRVLGGKRAYADILNGWYPWGMLQTLANREDFPQ